MLYIHALVTLALLFATTTFAEQTYHQPDMSGDRVVRTTQSGQNSGISWYENGQVWIGCSQNEGYYALNQDMTLAGSGTDHGQCIGRNTRCTLENVPWDCCSGAGTGTCATGNCADCNGGDCEAVAISGDTLYCLGESSGNMASYNLGDWRTGDYDFNGLDRLETWNTNALCGASTCEGLAVLPYVNGDEGGLAFIISKQTGVAYAITLADSATTYSSIGAANATFYPPASCDMSSTCSDWSGLDYDPHMMQLYWSADGGLGSCDNAADNSLCVATAPICSNDATKVCFLDSDCTPGTCTATAFIYQMVLMTSNVNDGEFEGLAICPGCGFVGLADDGGDFSTFPDSTFRRVP